MDARPATDNPLGLNLDFLYGRGFLWAEHENVTDWVTLEKLRMEIPDLTFPFDVRGGLSRFRDTRCTLRELDLRISEIGLVEALKEMWSGLEGFSDLDVRFLNGVILFATRVRAFGSDTFVTFRLGAMPGEPGSDVVRLLAHEFRAYGPLPCSARQLVHTLLKRAVGSEQIGAVGHGTSYAVELRGDSVMLRPLKLVLLHVFAQHGWKLPNLSRVVMGDLLCRPGGAVLRARSIDDDWTRDKSTGDGSPFLATAIAADEARSLFARGDEAAYAGRNEEALRAYQSFQDRYGTHPGLIERLLDVLLLEPKPGHLVEAEALCRDLEARDPESLVAAMGRAKIADARRERDESVERWATVAQLLTRRGESLDRAFCDLVVARHEGHRDPESAVRRLNDALRSEPRNRAALEELRAIFERTHQYAELEAVLKRLTGVAPDNESLAETYVALARHLMGQQSQIAEARAFLERALRIAPNRFEILDALGETWVQSGDPARAVKTLGSAATAARQRGDLRTASRLLFRIGQLWQESLGNREQALMQVRRALDLREEGGVNDPLGLAEQLRYAAQLCEEDRQQSEAIAYWTEALAALQLAEARIDGVERVEVRRALAATHRDIAAAYRARGRYDIAADHERRLVEMDPTDVDALDAMEEHFRREDGIASLVDTLRDAVSRIGPSAESLALRTRLAERLRELGRSDEAISALEQALDVAPGAERVRRLLSAILLETNQADRLQFQLAALRDRVQQRDVQWAITVEMGELALDALDDPDGAAMAFHDATLLLPARRDAYTRCRHVLEQLATQRGWQAGSPFGPSTIAEDLVALWQRAAESAPSQAERSKLRAELGDLLTAMGDAAPDGALAWSLAHELEEPPSGEIDMFEDSWSEAADAELSGDHDFDRELETRTVTRADATLTDARDETSVPWAKRTDAPVAPQSDIDTREISRASDEAREGIYETLELSRASDAERDRAFQTLELNRASDDDRDRVLQEVAMHAVAESSAGEIVAPPDPEPPFPTVETGDEPRRPSLSSLVSLDQAHAEVEQFREQYEESTRRPPDLPDLDSIAPNSALARILQRSARRAPRPSPELAETESYTDRSDRFDDQAKTKVERVLDVDALESRLSEARKANSDPQVADALEALLDTGQIADARRLDLTFELAELLYYELEDGDRALDWLLEVRRLDPTGYGARPGVLNAIEAIYEERGSVDGQVEILRARLDQAQSDDLRDTYRLLLAQLEWDRDAPDAARAWLEPVLEHDDRHEGARRLLADIAEGIGAWDEVAKHLKIAVSVAGDGLDSLELRKRLALVYLDRLGKPDEALQHFRTVQESAPQDAAVMDGVRRCQGAIGDWQGVVMSLQEELRLLLGVTLPADDDDDGWLEAVDPDTVSPPLRVPASHVLADIARVLQDELDRPADARTLWITVAELWPDHLEAVERRIDLDQKLEHHDSES